MPVVTRIRIDEIRPAIRSLVEEAVGDKDPLVFAVMRGGAHLALLYAQEGRKRVSIVLEHLLDLFPEREFADRDFIILDDTAYRGRALREAREKLLRHGVSPDRIATAALIVNRECPEDARPKHKRFELEGPDYNHATTMLNALARRLGRPTDVDHPLYFFRIAGAPRARVLDAIDGVARLRATGEPCDMDALVLDLGGASINPLRAFREGQSPRFDMAKLRLYLVPERESLHLTVAPLVYPTEFTYGELLGLLGNLRTRHGFASLHDVGSLSPRALYFMVCTALGFELLAGFLSELVTFLPTSVRIVCRPADHQFILVPAFYARYYAEAEKALARTIEAVSGSGQAHLQFSRAKLHENRTVRERVSLRQQQTGFSLPLLIAAEIGRDIAAGLSPPTYHDLVERLGDEAEVSSALDLLIDNGVLKAESRSSADELPRRVFLPGGEHRRIQVQRLASIMERDPLPLGRDEGEADEWGEGPWNP